MTEHDCFSEPCEHWRNAPRVAEIRQRFTTTFPNPEVLSGETATAIRDLLAHIDVLQDELDWYVERAQALRRYLMAKPPLALAATAVVTELTLRAEKIANG